MRDTIGVVGILLVLATSSSTLYADPPHGRGLPPGLQKKYDRGDRLPPGWRKKSSVYEYDYAEPLDYQDEPVYVEDKVIRIIRDIRDLTDPINQ
jgi:hypothetical protein